MAACFDADLDIIGPCGFALTDKALRRAAMDYAGHARVRRHDGLAAFLADPARATGRLILLEPDGRVRLHDMAFAPGDTLLLGRESAGSPPEVYDAAAVVVRIPLTAGLRSLNVAVAGAVALAEGLRQTGGFRGFP